MGKKMIYKHYLAKLKENNLINFTKVAELCDIKYYSLMHFINYFDENNKHFGISEKRLDHIVDTINKILEESKFKI